MSDEGIPASDWDEVNRLWKVRLAAVEAERDRFAGVVAAARALVADWRAKRSTHGGGLTAAVDALEAAETNRDGDTTT